MSKLDYLESQSGRCIFHNIAKLTAKSVLCKSDSRVLGRASQFEASKASVYDEMGVRTCRSNSVHPALDQHSHKSLIVHVLIKNTLNLFAFHNQRDSVGDFLLISGNCAAVSVCKSN